MSGGFAEKLINSQAVADIASMVEKAIRPILLRENERVVEQLERYIARVADLGKRVNRLERQLATATHCPTCGRAHTFED